MIPEQTDKKKCQTKIYTRHWYYLIFQQYNWVKESRISEKSAVQIHHFFFFLFIWGFSRLRKQKTVLRKRERERKTKCETRRTSYPRYENKKTKNNAKNKYYKCIPAMLILNPFETFRGKHWRRTLTTTRGDTTRHRLFGRSRSISRQDLVRTFPQTKRAPSRFFPKEEQDLVENSPRTVERASLVGVCTSFTLTAVPLVVEKTSP